MGVRSERLGRNVFPLAWRGGVFAATLSIYLFLRSPTPPYRIEVLSENISVNLPEVKMGRVTD